MKKNSHFQRDTKRRAVLGWFNRHMSASKQDPVGFRMSERDYENLEKLFKVLDKARLRVP